jgi:hypothetical protein
MNSLCGQNGDNLSVKPGGACNNHGTFKNDLESNLPYALVGTVI